MDKYDEKAGEIVNNAKRGTLSAVELGQVSGNGNIQDLLMVTIIDGVASELRKAGEREATLTKQLEGARKLFESISKGEHVIETYEHAVTNAMATLVKVEAMAREALSTLSTDKGEG